MPRTTLTPRTCGLLLTETTEDSSARYFPLPQTIGDEYVSLFAMSRTIGDSSGRCYLLSRTIRDEYVFHFSMFNRLSDGYPGRGVLHTPPAHLSSTHSPFAGRLVGRMQYAPTLSEKERFPWVGIFLLSRTIRDEYVFHFFMSNRLSDGYPGRGVLHTPLARLSSTLSPLAGRLVGRMQYAPTFPKKDKVSLGMCFLLSQTMADKYVFHFSMSNRLSDRYPGRGAKAYAPCAFIVYPFAPYGAFGRAYAIRPYPAGRKIGFEGLAWDYV